jgi:hypothetical protein
VGKLPSELIATDDHPNNRRYHHGCCSCQKSYSKALDVDHDRFSPEKIKANQKILCLTRVNRGFLWSRHKANRSAAYRWITRVTRWRFVYPIFLSLGEKSVSPEEWSLTGFLDYLIAAVILAPLLVIGATIESCGWRHTCSSYVRFTGARCILSLMEVSYGDLTIDLGGVLHDGRLSCDWLHCVPLRRTFRPFHPSCDGHYHIPSR